MRQAVEASSDPADNPFGLKDSVYLITQSYRCNKCGHGFVDLEALSAHDRSQHGPQTRKCPVPSCKHHRDGFKYWYECSRHVLQHYEASIACEYCSARNIPLGNRIFESADAFEHHLVEAHDPLLSMDESFSAACPVCSTETLTAWDLSIHLSYCVIRELQQLHSTSATEESQPMASGLETSQSTSVMHTADVDSKRSDHLNQGSSVDNESQRGNSRRKHAAMWQCHLCPKSFTRPLNLRAHVNNHKGARPFSCSICDLSFTRNNDRKTHEALHGGERRFACEVCGRKFSRLANLNRHARGHASKSSISSLKPETSSSADYKPGNNFVTDSQGAALVLTAISGVDVALGSPSPLEYIEWDGTVVEDPLFRML